MQQVIPAAAASPTKLTRVSEAIPLRYVSAADAATTINGFYEKKRARKMLTTINQAELPAIVAEPFNNHLFVSAIPEDIAEIKRLLKVMDIASKQYRVDAVVCEGEPLPTVREALDKGKIRILSTPQIVTMENQTATLNSGQEMEFPAGSGQTRTVGFSFQVTVGRASDKQVPVRAVSELSSVNKDRTTINVHRMDHSANHALGGRMRVRCGMTDSGKEWWIVMSVTEVNSSEQLEKVRKELPKP